MFARFRQTERRIQVSLVETRRVDGKVHHEHVAGLGSIQTPPSIKDRFRFWQRLHDRLVKLSNRIDAAMQAKILGDVHGRIPMVTLDEQRSVQLENAEEDERFWTGLRDLNQGQADGYKELAKTAERTAADHASAATDAVTNAAAAKDRVARIKRGEVVEGGFGQPVDYERILRDAGLTRSDIAHMLVVAALPEEADKKISEVERKAGRRAGRAAARRLAARVPQT